MIALRLWVGWGWGCLHWNRESGANTFSQKMIELKADSADNMALKLY